MDPFTFNPRALLAEIRKQPVVATVATGPPAETRSTQDGCNSCNGCSDPDSEIEIPPVSSPETPETKIRAIEEQAFRLGWTSEQLWNVCKRPDRRGLIWCLKPDQNIIEVTERYIELQRSSNGRTETHRFYNMSAGQPWIQRNKI